MIELENYTIFPFFFFFLIVSKKTTFPLSKAKKNKRYSGLNVYILNYSGHINNLWKWKFSFPETSRLTRQNPIKTNSTETFKKKCFSWRYLFQSNDLLIGMRTVHVRVTTSLERFRPCSTLMWKWKTSIFMLKWKDLEQPLSHLLVICHLPSTMHYKQKVCN